MSFQKITIIIAAIILIIALVIVGLSLSGKGSSDTQWPPIIGDCPDYWVDMQGDGSACMNSHNLGTCNLMNNDKGYSDQPNTNSMDNTLTEHVGVSQSQCKTLCSGSAMCFGSAYRNSTEQCFLKTEDVVKAETQNDPDFMLSLKNHESMNSNSKDFNVAPYTGANGTCAKYTWANNCGVVWDGINSGNSSNPCTSD